MNHRLFDGINRPGDVEKISPDAFRFHGPMKAMFYKVLKLVNPPPNEWLDEMTGNNAILRDIYYEYLLQERQQWRKDVLTRILPFSLCLGAHDSNYTEIEEFFLYKIIERADEFRFSPVSINPHCWYQDGRGRELPTKEETMRAIEMMNL